jgi:hypothetical protein
MRPANRQNGAGDKFTALGDHEDCGPCRMVRRGDLDAFNFPAVVTENDNEVLGRGQDAPYSADHGSPPKAFEKRLGGDDLDHQGWNG